ncbi:anthranilate synthase component I family protein [Halomarina oriensis]|uniref:anthranilate synthase n=1 Tax=Halomarina oriensis TaxID=671145 RepID=A0A6B0GKT4_9EURY|nr:anthranilate synthase component I family protein [Halomarina oriensis]MWG35230.1 anthranilate synthase component I [Halomarina oriensis]
MPTVVTDCASFLATASDALATHGGPQGGDRPAVRVPVEVRVTAAPFDAYRRARDDTPGVFYETSGGAEGWGYFATDPVALTTVPPDERALPVLERLLGGTALSRGDCDVPYPCGVFGWLSYDVARELEDLPTQAARDTAYPHLEVGTFDRVAAWRDPHDGETELRITACPVVDGADSSDDALTAAYETGRERALALAAAATDGDPSVGPPPVDTTSAEFESDCSRAEFAERVRHVKRAIRDGDTFQTNVSQRLRAPAAVHPVDAYAALREVNPAPYSGLVEFPSCDLVSASPELLLHADPDVDGTATRLLTEPIAGTRPRGSTLEEDDALEAELLANEKERAEHAMLVDLERNDLGKVSAFGSVEVSEYRRVDRYSEVMHLVSLVEGRLREDRTLADAVAAVFPGGTITGAPKPRTMELIDEVEPTRRGPYTGSMAVFGFDDRATLNIVIRTLARVGEEYRLRVGAGIVHDSDPEAEYDETLDKGRALVKALDAAVENRDLRVEGGSS